MQSKNFLKILIFYELVYSLNFRIFINRGLHKLSQHTSKSFEKPRSHDHTRAGELLSTKTVYIFNSNLQSVWQKIEKKKWSHVLKCKKTDTNKTA